MPISMIIPMHNSEKYVRQTISSAVKSLPTGAEIIIVDDGSVDQSYAICSEMVGTADGVDIRLIQQRHSGVSAARNKGLSLATKDYVTFFDADDTCDGRMHTRLLETIQAQDAQLCYCGYDTYNHDLTQIVRPFSFEYYTGTGLDVATKMAKDQLYVGVCNYLVCREIAQNIQFREGYCYGEDAAYTLNVLMRVDRVAAVSEPFYHYRMSPTNTVSTPRIEAFHDPLVLIELAGIVENEMPGHTSFISALKEQLIPKRILDIFYFLTCHGMDYQTIYGYIKSSGLIVYMGRMKGVNAKTSIMIRLWKISPLLLYRILTLRAKRTKH